MLDLVEETFAEYLLKISYPMDQLIDFAWTIYKIGGQSPMRSLSHFRETQDKVDTLSKTGIISWATSGVGKEFDMKSISVSLTEDFAEIINRGISRSEFKRFLFEKYGKDLIRFCKSELTKAAVYMLAFVIKYASPGRPVLSNTVVRQVSSIGMKSFGEGMDIVNYWLHKFLGLLKVDGSFVNLSEKSLGLIKENPYLWKVYNVEYREKTGPEPEKPKPKAPGTDKLERSLRGHFPWLKF